MVSIKDFLKNIIFDEEHKAKIAFLKKFSLFVGLDKRALSYVLDVIYKKTYKENEIIFSEGDIGRAVFFIKSGCVKIQKRVKDTNQQKVISNLKEGDFFGEMALLEEMPRSATAIVSETTEIFFIYKVRFDTLLEHKPRVGIVILQNLTKILSHRLRQISTDYAKVF